MKKNLNLFLKIILINLLFVSCSEASSKKNKHIDINHDKQNRTSSVLNINLANESDLISLGMSSDLIQEILSERPFLNLSDFSSLLIDFDNEKLFKKVFLPLNLNTANENDFKSIPGVGDRIAHEFEEYRPYSSIEQFKREIGKYVDDNEISRYLNYVFVPIELNTSSESNIKYLPGIGNKMAHEFIEYRPYQNMNQFRREIAKYVDKKELIRLERLVYLKK